MGEGATFVFAVSSHAPIILDIKPLSRAKQPITGLTLALALVDECVGSGVAFENYHAAGVTSQCHAY